MACRDHQASSAARVQACTPLSRVRTMNAGMALVCLALAACQHTTPMAISAPPASASVAQVAPASRFTPLHPSAILEELSARSRIPTSELHELLSDCARTQLSMNICTFRNFVELDLELNAALESKRESVAPECRAKIDRAHAAWMVERDKTCAEETGLDKGGSMRSMLIGDCKAEATKERLLIVKELDSCRQGSAAEPQNPRRIEILS